MSVVIGLFGTCGRSTWRDKFIKVYEEKGITYYNPFSDNWSPENALEESMHFASDDIIVFPITSEEYSIGSLSEMGFSLLNAIKVNSGRDFIILIDDEVASDLTNDELRKASITSRALVKNHLKRLMLPNVYVTNTLDELLEVSLELHEVHTIRERIRGFNLVHRGF